MLLTDLNEIKAMLDIHPDNTAEDTKLNLFAEMASQWIEEILDRPGLSRKARTEYYGGTDTQRLQLRSRPVLTTPTIQCFVDESGHFGASSGSFDATTTALTYGTDFVLDVDQDDGSSRSGILVRLNTTWPRPYARSRGLLTPFETDSFGTVKVSYTGGHTVDSLPAVFRLACNLLIARIRYILPLGYEIGSESYEERSISVITHEKNKLLDLVRPMILSHKNWKF